ncbi:MAG TPA: HprK-related kinase B [Methylophaga aminisulfidivorans]|uniref:HprK-related kinase B n=1 Tax=Methylophaga aminisulfidivorans TaxID=230105 RepID=A0A7C1W1V5_9GAMM|nr:HprK-related kinase B [Methylophaga aminisulfidivorans]
MTNDTHSVIESWLENYPPLQETLDIDLGFCSCRVRSNSAELLARLTTYFSSVVAKVANPTYIVTAIECEAPDLPSDFIDWKREPGKSGKKDSYVNLDKARLIRKVRTGMVFYQSADMAIAMGPCLDNDNQVINFINNQFMTWLQQNDALICHAACAVREGEAYAVAGFSGGGKSTLMLEMLEQDGTTFLTNDRMFIKQTPAGVQANGIPKLPRINPGTIVNNKRLQPLLTDELRQIFLSLSKDELWELEQKFDVDIDALYGEGRIQFEAPLKALLILNWSRHEQSDVALHQVNLRQRSDLLQAILKSPGPFYQSLDGEFISDGYQADEEAYLAILDNIAVYEATGGVNFQQLSALYLAVGQESL